MKEAKACISDSHLMQLNCHNNVKQPYNLKIFKQFVLTVLLNITFISFSQDPYSAIYFGSGAEKGRKIEPNPIKCLDPLVFGREIDFHQFSSRLEPMPTRIRVRASPGGGGADKRKATTR